MSPHILIIILIFIPITHCVHYYYLHFYYVTCYCTITTYWGHGPAPNHMHLPFRQALNLPADTIPGAIDEMTPRQFMRSVPSQPHQQDTDATQFFPSPALPSLTT